MMAATQDPSRPTVLVVDDEADIRDLARAILEIDGFAVVEEAEDGPQALQRYVELDPPLTPTVVLLDNRMPGLSGLQVAQQMLSDHPEQTIVLFSAHLEASVVAEARELGIAASVSKTDTQRLPAILRSLISAR